MKEESAPSVCSVSILIELQRMLTTCTLMNFKNVIFLSSESSYEAVMECFHSVLWDSNDKGHGGHVGVPNKRS